MKNPFQRKKPTDKVPTQSDQAAQSEETPWPGVQAQPPEQTPPETPSDEMPSAAPASAEDTPEPEWVAATQPQPETSAEFPPDEFSPEWKADKAAAEQSAAEAQETPAAEGPDAADEAIAAAAASATATAVGGADESGAQVAASRKGRRAKARRGGKEGGRPGLVAWITTSFKDPGRRPRAIIWTLAAIVGIAAIMIVALGATSTYWFCANGCHKVQDDTISAYQASTHNKVSCMACHMPVAANPVTFILHKAEALGELYMTVTNNFELPLNAESFVSLEMPSKQCTQCHSTNRLITPTTGVKIDHKVHAEKDVQCPECHNRIAHNDVAAKPVLNDPKTGEKNHPHENFMTMTACFRCHTQAKGGLASGDCIVCHPANFELKPPSHLAKGFFPKGHGELAKAEAERVAKAKAGEVTQTVSGESAESAKEAAPKSGLTEREVPEGILLPPVATINECYTCHDAETFCNACHGGVEMPHPAGFKAKHADVAKQHPDSCAQCHGKGNAGCNSCHHGSAMGLKYNPKIPWKQQHPQAVQAKGATACFECHDPTYCARCHVRGNQ